MSIAWRYVDRLPILEKVMESTADGLPFSPTGESGIAAACAAHSTLQVISQNASLSPETIIGPHPCHPFAWQLYVQTTTTKSEAMLARVNNLPNIKFLVLTLDAPVPGKREDDERYAEIGKRLPITSAVKGGSASKPGGGEGKGGVGKSLFAGTSPKLTWKRTLPWLAKHTSLPIVLKGIQTHEDAYLASNHPQVKGIILSNHGGRAADTAPPAVHTLLEIRRHCPTVFDKLEVFVDGGVRRGTDVVKALCLGARCVGIGRAALWGLGAGGSQGVSRTLEILEEEMKTCMRLLGVRDVMALGPQHINTRAVERDIYDGPARLEAEKMKNELRAKL